jgi:NAD(P)H-dependent FMN reductase
MYLIFVSSLNENMRLALKLQEQLRLKGAKAEVINLVELALPMYDSFKEEKNGIPEKVSSIMGMMEKSEGYLFVSPEYNYSIPPVLTNFIAWVSRAGDDFRKLFNEKAILLATHSGSGGNDVLNSMRIQFSRLGALVLPRQVLTTLKIKLNEKSALKTVEQFIRLSKL